MGWLSRETSFFFLRKLPCFGNSFLIKNVQFLFVIILIDKQKGQFEDRKKNIYDIYHISFMFMFVDEG